MTRVHRSVVSSIVVLALSAPAMLAQRAPMVDSYAPVVKKAQPAVVNISTTVVRKSRASEMPDIFDFFGQGGARPPREQRGHSLGSGVIIRQDGYLLTNNHVIEGATDIKVALSDRRELKAKLIGTDPQSDIAVLKVEAKDLPTMPMGNSAQAEVGDVVLALGNPFGIGQTVTMGIIGAIGRSGLNIEQYEDFIQTDAAINPGNSGGALINTRGELIAINTAILSGSGGSQGVGFAVPINMARNVMEQILKTGKVTRGYMGAGIQEVTPDLAQGLGLKDSSGVVLTQVEPSGPAAKAGLKAGDVITAIDGKPVATSNALRLRISGTAPGTTVKLRTVRENGATQEIPVTLAQLPTERGERGEGEGTPGKQGEALQGVALEDLTPQLSRRLGISRDIKGVIVSEVDPSSPAADAGLRRGDIIQRVNRQPVTTTKEVEGVLRQGSGKSVLLLINRGGNTAFIVVEAGK
jgi:Do/DeqQ family serine protease